MTEKVKHRYRVRIPRMHWTNHIEDVAKGVIVACALIAITLLFLILAGCTTLAYEQQKELALQARGCYCAGTGCDEIKSAAGQAAVAAAGGQVVNITEIQKVKSE